MGWIGEAQSDPSSRLDHHDSPLAKGNQFNPDVAGLQETGTQSAPHLSPLLTLRT